MTYALILAGGRGERFWPLSRVSRAKQFLCLDGERSLLSATAGRIQPLVPWERMLVVTGADQVGQVRAALPDLPPDQILGEPAGRNTAPAAALGAAWVARRDPSAVLIVVPSDAWVGDDDAYRGSLAAAVAHAGGADALGTIGIVPTRPETGYGYLECGPAVAGGGNILEVRRFVEKPDVKTAFDYLAGGRHLWNCGIFVMKVDSLRAAVERHLPEVARSLRQAEAGGLTTPAALERYYASVPAVSIDYGIMEKAGRVFTVKGTFPWDDLGSWVALERVLPAEKGVVSRGDVLALDSPGSILIADEGLVATLGLENVVVVRTADATLVAPKERAQEVRRIVQALAARPEWKKYL